MMARMNLNVISQACVVFLQHLDMALLMSELICSHASRLAAFVAKEV